MESEKKLKKESNILARRVEWRKEKEGQPAENEGAHDDGQSPRSTLLMHVLDHVA